MHTVDVGRIGTASVKTKMSSSRARAPPPPTMSVADILSACDGNLKTVGLSCDLTKDSRVGMVNNFLQNKGRHVKHLRLSFRETPAGIESDDYYMTSDLKGKDGFGRASVFPSCEKTAKLSQCCLSLKTITFALLMNRESESEVITKRSDAIVQWRCAPPSHRVCSSFPYLHCHRVEVGRGAPGIQESHES